VPILGKFFLRAGVLALRLEEGSGVSPMAETRSAGLAQRFCGVFHGETCEQPELGEVCCRLVFYGELGQSLVQGEDVVGGSGEGDLGIVQLDAFYPAPAFGVALCRAMSMRIRRMASAAAAKKWPRLPQL
jgi:hypothetical protein